MSDKDRIRQLETALEFYADPSDYVAPLTGGMGRLWKDCGATARVALNESFRGDDKIVTPYSPYKDGRFVS